MTSNKVHHLAFFQRYLWTKSTAFSLNSSPEVTQNAFSRMKITKSFTSSEPHFLNFFNLFPDYSSNSDHRCQNLTVAQIIVGSDQSFDLIWWYDIQNWPSPIQFRDIPGFSLEDVKNRILSKIGRALSTICESKFFPLFLSSPLTPQSTISQPHDFWRLWELVIDFREIQQHWQTLYCFHSIITLLK
jgi:hypothetical protein